MTSQHELEQKIRILEAENKTLNETLKSYAAIFNNAFDLILIINGDTGNIVESNKVCENLLGFLPEELIGHHFSILFDKISTFESDEILNEIKIFGPVLSYRKVKKKDGSFRLMDMTINMIKLGESNLILTNLRDAEDRAKAEQEIKQFSQQLSDLNKTKDKFFSIIAHDLKNPFNSLLGFSEILTTEYDDISDEEKLLYMTEIRKVSKSSYQLLENLLNWARAQTGKIQYEPSELDLKFLLKEVINLVALQATAKNITIELMFDENFVIYSDDDLIMTVVRNLLTNAIKYSKQDSIIEIDAKLMDDFYLQLSIKDYGTGIPKEIIDSLFDIGRGESKPGTSNEKGTGLGLILCKEFIELNKGKIWFENNSTTGATFFVSIPIKEIPEIIPSESDFDF